MVANPLFKSWVTSGKGHSLGTKGLNDSHHTQTTYPSSSLAVETALLSRVSSPGGPYCVQPTEVEAKARAVVRRKSQQVAGRNPKSVSFGFVLAVYPLYTQNGSSPTSVCTDDSTPSVAQVFVLGAVYRLSQCWRQERAGNDCLTGGRRQHPRGRWWIRSQDVTMFNVT